MLSSAGLIGDLIDGIAARVIAHAEELTALDQAIGDGDHGLNMKRGFEAVLVDLDQHAAKPLPEALKAIGMALVEPLYFDASGNRVGIA